MARKSALSERLEAVAQETAPPLPPKPEETPALVDGAANEPASTDVMARARRGRAAPIPNESKHDKLIRLADARVSKACKAIMVIGNLVAYKPSPREIEMIMQALGEACASVANRLNGIRRESIVFTLR